MLWPTFWISYHVVSTLTMPSKDAYVGSLLRFGTVPVCVCVSEPEDAPLREQSVNQAVRS